MPARGCSPRSSSRAGCPARTRTRSSSATRCARPTSDGPSRSCSSPTRMSPRCSPRRTWRRASPTRRSSPMRRRSSPDWTRSRRSYWTEPSRRSAPMLAERFLRSGKVRDLYELPDGRLLLVASDRISAFDVVLPTEIPDKGRVLTGLSRFWFAETAGLARNHLLGVDPVEVESGFVEALAARGLPAAEAERLRGGTDRLRGRIMLCRPAQVLPIEAVVRGYLDGSAWKAYQATGEICGVPLPPGLRQGDRLPAPIFTPATKAPQ